MLQNKALYWASVILVLVGGINLGLVGLFGFDLISNVLGVGIARLIFMLVGLGSAFLIARFVKSGGMAQAMSDIKGAKKDDKPAPSDDANQDQDQDKDQGKDQDKDS